MELLDPIRFYSGFGIGWGSMGGSNEPPQYVSSVIDHEAAAARRIISQYQNLATSNLVGIVEVHGARWQAIEDICALVLSKRNVNDAFGVLLDSIGERVGLRREGREDNSFRTLIGGRIIANASRATPEDVRAVLDMLMQGVNTVRLVLAPPGTTLLRTAQISQEDGELFAHIAQRAVPIATRLVLQWELPVELGASFGFEDDNTAGPWLEAGGDPADAGLWAEGSDGGPT